ncbi:hypothetical protein OG976_23475 [Mycobacterium sp. NBC_00419]|uniref:hypothetical protein n=1 Tax=Mycobacterium sp. NBC_00419 TaxID=2975989 RepID=UPI002E1C1191
MVAFALSVAFGSVLFWLTIPMAALAGSRIRKSQQGGAGLARAALVISCIYVALAIVVVALAAYLSSSSAAVTFGTA